ncbi:hypothetical protein Tco_0905194 [Tanacetum coccineum]
MLTAHDFSASIPIRLQELPTKVREINEALGNLNEYVEKLEIDVRTDVKGIPEKLEEFQTSISVLTTKVASLEGLKLDILAGLLALPDQVSSINAQLIKLKALDAILSILGKVATAMDKFTNSINSTSQKAGDHSVPSAGQLHIIISPTKAIPQTEGEQVKDKGKKVMSHEEMVKADAVRSERKKGKKFLIKTLGQDVVEKVYKDKVLRRLQEHLHINLRGGSETKDKTLTRASVQLGEGAPAVSQDVRIANEDASAPHRA